MNRTATVRVETFGWIGWMGWTRRGAAPACRVMVPTCDEGLSVFPGTVRPGSPQS